MVVFFQILVKMTLTVALPLDPVMFASMVNVSVDLLNVIRLPTDAIKSMKIINSAYAESNLTSHATLTLSELSV